MKDKEENITHPTQNLSTFRIETLEDGVFAIVMTLLIFDLRLPDAQGQQSLWQSLVKLLPNIIGFFISFLVLGVYWFGHRAMFHYIKHADHNMHWLNIIFLAFVALVPVSTAILAKHLSDHLAITLYALNLIIIGIMFYLHWRYAIKAKLLQDDIPAFVIRYAKQRSLFAPICYLAAIALSFIHVNISLIMFAIVPMLYILPFVQRQWVKAAIGRSG
jgi:uncharacterized membrane protein